MTITTATGRIFNCDAVTAATVRPALHIHTSALGMAEAAAIFSDPAETAELTKTWEDGEGQQEQVFRGYTELFALQRSPFVPGDLLIWLEIPGGREE